MLAHPDMLFQVFWACTEDPILRNNIVRKADIEHGYSLLRGPDIPNIKLVGLMHANKSPCRPQ